MPDFVTAVKSSLKRIPTRPVDLRGERFDANFDFDTLFYDCFRVSRQEVMIIAPALFNLHSLMLKSAFYAGHEKVKIKIEPFKLVTRIRLFVPEVVKTLHLKGEIGDYHFDIRENGLALFKDMRLIVTVQKDNDLQWIVDWVTFMRDVHGAEAVLIYDNGSTRYTLAALEATLAAIKGLKAYKVVAWNFIYGPGPPPTLPSSKMYWDSNFCQAAALEHSRRCYWQKAKCVSFSDVDELIVSTKGQSIFDATEKSLIGLTMTPGRWIVAVEEPPKPPRHKNFTTLLKKKPYLKKGFIPSDANGCKTKWTVNPRKLPDFVMLDVHNMVNWIFCRFISRDFTFRHFRNINLNWFDDRIKTDIFSDETHEKDVYLMRDLAKVIE